MFRLLNWYFFFICIYFVYGKILQQHIQVVHLATPAVGYITNQHSFKAFIAWTIGFCTFILLLETGAYKYQFTQFGWTHVTLLMIVVSASSMVNNMYDGMVSRAQATFFCHAISRAAPASSQCPTN
jgi:phosphatidate cytidylyltransferase